MSSSNRILVWGGGIIVALLLVAGILNATREVEPLDPATPEGVVQLFMNAVLDGNEFETKQYLSADFQDECEFNNNFRRGEGSFVEANLVDITVRADDRAEVEVKITEGSYGLFESYDYSHREQFLLEKSNGDWLITDLTWPWWDC